MAINTETGSRVDTTVDTTVEPSIGSKQEMLKLGLCIIPPPPVCTAKWNTVDWIAFIDSNGTWYYKYYCLLNRIKKISDYAYTAMLKMKLPSIDVGDLVACFSFIDSAESFDYWWDIANKLDELGSK